MTEKARREIGRRLRKGRCDDVYDDHQCHVVVSLQRRKQQQQEYHSSADHRGSSRGGVQDSQNEVMGRVKLVSDTEITVEQGLVEHQPEQ